MLVHWQLRYLYCANYISDFRSRALGISLLISTITISSAIYSILKRHQRAFCLQRDKNAGHSKIARITAQIRYDYGPFRHML